MKTYWTQARKQERAKWIADKTAEDPTFPERLEKWEKEMRDNLPNNVLRTDAADAERRKMTEPLFLAKQWEDERWQELVTTVTPLLRKNKQLRDVFMDYVAAHNHLRDTQRLVEAYSDNQFVRSAPVITEARRRVGTLQTNAAVGGRNTGHYTDAQVTSAFTDYKRRNPGKNAWDAANALIRPGKALSDYKHVNGPWNRSGRIAGQLGITRDEWFDAL